MKRSGDTALVVGGSRGIGRAIALSLADAGFDIWLTYRSNHDAADEVQGLVEAKGVGCDTMSFDIGDYDATQAALAERAAENPPYAFVFCAGIARDNLMVWMAKDEWCDVVDTDLNGFYNVTHAILLPMLSRKRGRIVLISSTSGQIGQAGQANYSAAKAGLIGAGKALAREIGRKNVLVNVVTPGVIETEMTTDLPRDKIMPLIPQQRFGRPEEVASLVSYLCSEEPMYIHGQVIGVNGGLAM